MASDLEMQTVGYGNSSAGAGGRNLQILSDCRQLDIDISVLNRAIDELEGRQNAALEASGRDPEAGQWLDRANEDILREHMGLVERVKRLKTTPGAANPQNAPQVRLCDQKLTASFQRYQTVEMQYRRIFREQLARQYRIVHPEATQAEAMAQAGSDVFAQALMNSDRRGQAQSTLQDVRTRHEAIQQVEQQMATLATLFERMNNTVLEQEVATVYIGEQSEAIKTDLHGADGHLQKAVTTARATRRKKWMCLGITILIILIAVAAIVAALKATGH